MSDFGLSASRKCSCQLIVRVIFPPECQQPTKHNYSYHTLSALALSNRCFQYAIWLCCIHIGIIMELPITMITPVRTQLVNEWWLLLCLAKPVNTKPWGNTPNLQATTYTGPPVADTKEMTSPHISWVGGAVPNVLLCISNQWIGRSLLFNSLHPFIHYIDSHCQKL